MADRAFRAYRCRICSTVSKGDVEATLSPSIVIAYCTSCKKRTPSEDLGLVEAPAPIPTNLVDEARRVFAEDRDLEELLGPGERFWIGEPSERRVVDRATALAALESGEDGGTIVRAADDVVLEDDHVQAAYREWRKTSDGLAVVEAIRRRAIELRRRGWRRYGIQALAEVVRFDRALSVGPDAAGYRVNNSHLSRLARDLMAEDPDLAGFFEVRELRTEG